MSRNGNWGGEPEIVACCYAINVNIRLYSYISSQLFTPMTNIKSNGVIRLYYSGIHYNSIKNKSANYIHLFEEPSKEVEDQEVEEVYQDQEMKNLTNLEIISPENAYSLFKSLSCQLFGDEKFDKYVRIEYNFFIY